MNVYEDKDVIVKMVSTYQDAKTQDQRDQAVQTISQDLGKSPASVRSKLSFLGVYIAKARTTKDGQPIVRKSELVDKIVKECALALTEAEATSLEKATKTTLLKLLGLKDRLVDFVDE